MKYGLYLGDGCPGEGMWRLTLVVDAAILILLSLHESVDLNLCHLLACRGDNAQTQQCNHTSNGFNILIGQQQYNKQHFICFFQ